MNGSDAPDCFVWTARSLNVTGCEIAFSRSILRPASTNVQYKIRGFILLLAVCVLLLRHSDVRAYIPPAENLKAGECATVEWHVTEAALDTYDYVENYPYMDYEFIEQYHQILWHDIYSMSTNDYAGMPLEEYLKPIEESDREQLALYVRGTSLSMDYITFDFNDDGLEDYMVCYYGIRWIGSGGNNVDIYVQTSRGSLRRVFTVTMRLHDKNLLNAHAPVAVLDEKTDRFYAIVQPGSNRIIRYDKEAGRYQFQERE